MNRIETRNPHVDAPPLRPHLQRLRERTDWRHGAVLAVAFAVPVALLLLFDGALKDRWPVPGAHDAGAAAPLLPRMDAPALPEAEATSTAGSAAVLAGLSGDAAMPPPVQAAVEVLRRGQALVLAVTLHHAQGHDGAGQVQAATGRLWGVATYRTADGRTLKVPSQAGINADEPDAAENADFAQTFSARWQTFKTLVFDRPPADTIGSFLSYDVYVQDDATTTIHLVWHADSVKK